MMSSTTVVVIAVVALVIGIVLGRKRSKDRTVVWREERQAGEGSGSPVVDAEVDAFLRKGQLIAAIKRYREVSGVGLKEAKDAVEARQRELK
jgi:ribosomal protein L7/L12